VNEDQQPLRKIFNDAVEIADAQQRADFLAVACGADAALRRRVEELIAANDDAGAFLGGGADSVANIARDLPSVTDVSEELQDRTIRYFGDYQLLEEIARGGMGVVFKARQTNLNRTVALKTIIAGKLASSALVQRFQTEAEAAANLKHANIVAIHEVGEHEGQHYFSMDYIEGQNLAERMQEGLMPLKEAADCVQTIARAIHYAHQRGVLHRDLKPSNILLDRHGQPHVTDFGLARLVEHESTLTQTQDVMGTPSYMAPEQAAGERQLTTAADIYSLGAILYELLTGRPPFRAGTALETMRQVMEQEPKTPSLVRSNGREEALTSSEVRSPKSKLDKTRGLPTSAATEVLDRDLEPICLKCLHKDRIKRYGSAEALAEDLARWRAGAPILARPVSQPERLWRWCRRNPATASLVISIAVLMMAIAVGSTMAAFRIARESERARKAEIMALEKNREAKEELRSSYLAQARANRWSGRAGRRFESLEVLGKAAAIRPSLELRNEAIACLTLADIRLLKQSEALKKQKESVCLDRNKERYAQADERGDVHVCRVSDDKQLMLLPGGLADQPKPEIMQRLVLGFSPDGQLLAVCYPTGRARIWDVQRRQTILEVPVGGYGEGRFDFSPDSKRLATSDVKRNLHLFDLGERRECSLKTASEGGILRFDPTGKVLAVDHLQELRILEPFTGKVLVRLKHPGTYAFGLAWHPDGRHLASACEDRAVYVWDTWRGELVRVLKGHDREAVQVAFNPRGDLLASTGFDGTIRLWDFASGRELVRITGGGLNLQFSPDGQSLGCDSWDANWFEIFEIASTRVLRAFHEAKGGRDRGYGPLGFTEDGGLLAYSAGDQLKMWDVATGREMVSHPAGWLRAIVFDTPGQNLFLSGPRGLSRWPMHPASASGSIRVGPPMALTPNSEFGQAGLSADGKILAVVATNRCYILHPDSTNEPARTEIQTWMHYVAVHPAGTWIATGAWGKEGVKVWDGVTGRLCQELPSGDHTAVVFSPDGRWLVTGSEIEYQFWNTGEWTRGLRIPHPSPTSVRDTSCAMAFSPDGSILALTDPRTVVRLTDSASGRELATLQTENGKEISSLAFSFDGTWLAVGGGSDSLHVWDLRAIRLHLAKLGFDWETPPLPPAHPPIIKYANIAFIGDKTADTAEPPPDLLAKIPKRDSHAHPNLIDLTPYYNAALKGNWHGDPVEDNDLAGLTNGLQTLAGIQFDVRWLIQVGIKPGAGGNYLKRVSGIEVGRTCQRIHFLHSAIRSGTLTNGTRLGSYLIHFANGQSWEQPILCGEDLRDWWWEEPKQAVEETGPGVAWIGTNGSSRREGKRIRLYVSSWDVPLPDVEIQTIDFVCEQNRGAPIFMPAPFLVAITVESLDGRSPRPVLP